MSIKYNSCIHCGLPPYPICPECGGYWSGDYWMRPSCSLCGHIPTDEQLAVIFKASKKYQEHKETGQDFKQEARERYDKLHSLYIKTISLSPDPSELLALIRALKIARAEASGQ